MNFQMPTSYSITSQQGRWIRDRDGISFEPSFVKHTIKDLGAVEQIRPIEETDRTFRTDAPLKSIVAIHPNAKSVIELRDGTKIYVSEDFRAVLQKVGAGYGAPLSSVERLMIDFYHDINPQDKRFSPHVSGPTVSPDSSRWRDSGIEEVSLRDYMTWGNMKTAGKFTGACLAGCIAVASAWTGMSRLTAPMVTSDDFMTATNNGYNVNAVTCDAAFSNTGINLPALDVAIKRLVTGDATGAITLDQFKQCRNAITYTVYANRNSPSLQETDYERLLGVRRVGEFVNWAWQANVKLPVAVKQPAP
ncbi:MAG: hypothetical protein KGI37_05300 [Alphaproteobacteria bacterium]|nr:hypothetical protein [Alphaproteobacteria bacterium]